MSAVRTESTNPIVHAILLDNSHRELVREGRSQEAIDRLKEAVKIFPDSDPRANDELNRNLRERKAEIAIHLVDLLEKKGDKNIVNSQIKNDQYKYIAMHASSEFKHDRVNAISKFYDNCKKSGTNLTEVGFCIAKLMLETRRGEDKFMVKIKDLIKKDPELKEAIMDGLKNRGKKDIPQEQQQKNLNETRKAKQDTVLGSWLNEQAAESKSLGQRLKEFFTSSNDNQKPDESRQTTPRMGGR